MPSCIILVPVLIGGIPGVEFNGIATTVIITRYAIDRQAQFWLTRDIST